MEVIEKNDNVGLAVPILRGDETFALRVRGDSMAEEQIREGDVLLVERTSALENGDTAVAVIDGAKVTIKKWFGQDDGTVRFESVSLSVEPLILPAERVAIHGRVIGLLRKHR